MPGESTKPKKVLFVDDDRNYLSLIQQLFSQLAKGSWEISTAQNHAQALEILRKGRVDLVVLDFKMPVMDGLQFLKLLGRTHPGQQVAILSGRADGAERKVCEESGALLVLQKPVGNEGFASVFSALDALASAAPQEGFRGMMRRLGIGEVLQMECLGSKSSVLEIFTGKVRGKIFICDGAIIHAETGAIQGETALYGLLGLTGGEFNFSEYTEPPRRTIEGSWEGLLMEAARLVDVGEGQIVLEPEPETPVAAAKTPAEVAPEAMFQPVQSAKVATALATKPAPPVEVDTEVQIEEILLASSGGNVLYEWECKKVEGRLKLMEQVEAQARQVSEAVKVGVFDRLEIVTPKGRIVCQVQPQRRVFVRSTRGKQPGL
ncbi:MAG: response regulator [Limisphaerales bacterium]